MKFAAIDIGSNSAKLVFIQVLGEGQDAQLITDAVYKVPLKLGADVFSLGIISSSKAKDFLNTMIAYQKLIEVYQPLDYIACATSAMRDASNGMEIIATTKKETGIDISIISGEQEADILIANYASIFNRHPDENFLFIDVGGGSTEIVVVSQGKLVSRKSFNIGAVRLRDQLVKAESWNQLSLHLNNIKQQYGSIQLVGTGGSINEIEKKFNKGKDKKIPTAYIFELHQQLKNASIEDRVIQYGIRIDRADIILPAAEIFLFILQLFDAEEILAPKTGLAHGLVFRMYQDYVQHQ